MDITHTTQSRRSGKKLFRGKSSEFYVLSHPPYLIVTGCVMSGKDERKSKRYVSVLCIAL